MALVYFLGALTILCIPVLIFTLIELRKTTKNNKDMTYAENLEELDDHLQSAMDCIKATLITEHPTNSGDKLVEIADILTKARHKLIDLLHE